MLIAFSGSSLSGKTTTMNKLYKLFSDDGYDVIFLDENIRDYYDTSIDDIRSNPSLYLDVQFNAINHKIERELFLQNHKNGKNKTIVLIDRSISDSLFYALHYVNSDSFSDAELIKYSNLIDNIKQHININPYDIVIDFGLLDDDTKSDRHRPSNIHSKKHVEFSGINLLSNLLKPKHRIYIEPSKINHTIDDDYIKIKNNILKFL